MTNRSFWTALAMWPVIVAPAAAVPLVPTGQWVVDFAPAHCTAVRDYGTKEKPLALVFKPSVIGDVMTLAIVRDGAESEIVQHGVALQLDAGAPMRVSLLAFSPKGLKRRVEMINLPLESFSAVRRSGSLSVAGSGVASRSFSLSGMAALMKAMDTCLADLQQVWNVSEEAKGRLKEEPRPTKPLFGFFKSEDYPGIAVRDGQSGVVALALLIDEAGKIADCTVIQTSGVATLDSQSCAVINTRAAFHPAVGADGRPAKAAVIQRIRWELPR